MTAPAPHLHPAPSPPPGLRLVQRSAPRGRSPLQLWHLLSLDAPTVAALWTLFVAGSAGVRLPWTEPAAMFLAVWMLYAADRLLDARPLSLAAAPNGQPGLPNGANLGNLEDRHRFHFLHRARFLPSIAVASLALAALLHRIDPRSLHLFALLATLLAAWFLLIHALPGNDDLRLPKELAVGVFFPAAILVPTLARLPGEALQLLPAACLFAGVCTFNCLLLYAWEHPQVRSPISPSPVSLRRAFEPSFSADTSPTPAAHWTTQLAVGHLPTLGACLLALSLIAAARPGPTALRPPAAACALSTALLLGLHRFRSGFTPLTLRAAADLVLLTPLLWLPWLRFGLPGAVR